MPEKLRSIPQITGVTLARERHKAWSKKPVEQRFISDAVETDWGKVIRDHQVIKKTSPLKQRSKEIILPKGDAEVRQEAEAHPEEEKLVIVIQYFGVDIKGEFRPGENDYGKGNTVFYTPISFWKNGKAKQTSLIVASWGEKEILEFQITHKINKNLLFPTQEISLTELLVNYEPDPDGNHPIIDNYNLAEMKISANGNTVVITYPHKI